MAEQFLRKASLVIGAGTQALDLSDMHFTFEVQAATVDNFMPKTAYVRVYNLSNQTARTIATEGTQLILSAGYAGNFDTVFSGQISQARIGRENGTDTYLDITAADGDQVYNFGTVNFTLAAGTDVIGRLGQLANAAGVKLGVVHAPPDGAKLPRGRTYFGLLRDHLTTEAASIGADWCIENGVIDVINQSGYKQGDIAVITSATGMIGVPEQTELGISVRCLLNPGLRQNMRVQLDNRSIRQYQAPVGLDGAVATNLVPTLAADGIYKVLYVNHLGDTRGQDWYSDFVAYSRIVPSEAQLSYFPKIY